MHTSTNKWLGGLILLAFVGPGEAAEPGYNKDVTYFAIVKNHIFAQDGRGRVTETGYSFLGYIFLRHDSQISDAYLTFPGNNSKKESFPDYRRVAGVERDTYLFIKSDRIYRDKEAYDQDYPDGEYTVEFTTAAGDHRATINMAGGIYPGPARMTLYQGETQVGPDIISPTQELRVVWGGFPQGQADANGILDDVVFVIVKDCHGGKVLHSGRPFQGSHLLYTDKDYVIPARTMLPGRRYELIVDNGRVVGSNTDAGVPGVGFYAQTNKMWINTTGGAGKNTDCGVR